MTSNITKLVCESCGSIGLRKENDYYVCRHCGTKYLSKDIDDSGKYIKYKLQGDRFLLESNYRDAKKYYDLILEYDMDDPLANIYCRMCTLMLSNYEEVKINITNFIRSFPIMIHLMKDKYGNEPKNTLIGLLYVQMTTISGELFERTKYYSNYKKDRLVDEIKYLATTIMTEWDDIIAKEFKFKPDDDYNELITLNKRVYRQFYECGNEYKPDEIKQKMSKALKYVHRYEPDWGYIGNGMWMV